MILILYTNWKNVVGRSTKQGGTMSMFQNDLNCSDLYDFVNGAGCGLNVGDIDIDSPSFADDSALLSDTKKGCRI